MVSIPFSEGHINYLMASGRAEYTLEKVHAETEAET